MKPLSPRYALLSASFALSAFAGTTLAAGELVPLNDFAFPSDFTLNFSVTTGFAGLAIAHSVEDDGGIGRGGFVEIPAETGATSNIVYDTDGLPGTQTFGDVTIAVDHQSSHSVGFIVRGNASRSDSIRVLVTDLARVRIWTGSNVDDHNPGGTLHYDVTGPAAGGGWSHLRLDVRNVGDGGNQIELVLRAFRSQVRFDETTQSMEHSLTLSVADSAAYLDPGEIGFRMIGIGTRIDNFAVYEYGTAPAALPHPELVNLYPQDRAEFHSAGDGLNFEVRSFAGIETGDISVLLNFMDISADLVISGTPEHRVVHYPHLDPDVDYEAQIEVASGDVVTTRTVRFRTTAPHEPVPLIDLIEFVDESEFTNNFVTLDGTMFYGEDWDRGIGRGGMIHNAGNTNFLYDTDGEAGTQIFQDFSATFDHRVGGSLGFIIRADRQNDRSIRIMLTNRNLLRVWTGSGIADGGTAGTQQFGQTYATGISPDEWVHMRLDVRNVGAEWEAKIELKLSVFTSQNDLAAPAFQETVVLEGAWDYMAAGEVGARLIHGTNHVDNFGIYEYGKAPVWRPHPAIRNISPSPDLLEYQAEELLTFEVTGRSPTPAGGIVLRLNGEDVSQGLALEGNEHHWYVTYDSVSLGTRVEIEATSAGATTTAFFDIGTPPGVTGLPFTVFQSGGFESDELYPLGALQPVEAFGWRWAPHGTTPGEIVAVDDPSNKVLRRVQPGSDTLFLPLINGGIVTYELDVRVSTAERRTLHMALHEGPTGGRAASFIGWGTVAGNFAYFDGSAWVPIFPIEANRWYHFRFVNYLTGAHANSFDLIIDGELIGQKLSFRHGAVTEVTRLLLAASNGTAGDYAEVDNLVVTAQALLGADQLPVSVVRNLNHSGTEFSVSFDSFAGYGYSLEYTPELGSGVWTQVATGAGNGVVLTLTDPNPSADRGIYRVTTVPGS